MSKFIVEIELENDNYCFGCDFCDINSLGDYLPYASCSKNEEELVVDEIAGRLWVIRTPRCPLKKVENT